MARDVAPACRAQVDADGFWFLQGRSDDTLKIAGKRVGPAEVESVLVGHPAVAEAGVVGVPHPVKGDYHARRDLVGDLSDAVRSRHMRMGLYYSGGYDCIDVPAQPPPSRAALPPE